MSTSSNSSSSRDLSDNLNVHYSRYRFNFGGFNFVYNMHSSTILAISANCFFAMQVKIPLMRALKKSPPNLLLRGQLIIIQNILPSHFQSSIWWESMLLFLLCAQTINNSKLFLYRENFLCDVILLTTDQQEFSAHKAVLASCSPYFHAMFSCFEESHQNRIVLQDIDPKALSLLLDYVYTSEIQVNEDNVQVLKFLTFLYSKNIFD